MTLSKEAIQEFKELFRKRFNKELSDQEAFDRGMRLLNMYQVVYGDSIKDLPYGDERSINRLGIK